MASFLFNTGLSRLSKFYAEKEEEGVTYTKTGQGPQLPRKLQGFLGRNAYKDLTSGENYNLEDISKFADIWPLLKGDAKAREVKLDNIPVPGKPLIDIFYSKICKAEKTDKKNHHLVHNLECRHRCGVLFDDLFPLNPMDKNNKRYDATSAFSSFVLNDEEAQARIGTISKDSKRENLLFLLKEINRLQAGDPIRDALLQGLNENLNKKDSIKGLLNLLQDAPKKQTGLVADTFGELLKLQETKTALLQYTSEHYKPDENLQYKEFPLKQLYLNHKSCFNVAIETFLADGNLVPIDLLIPQAHFGNFKQVFLERHFNNIIDTKWDEILTHRVKQVWPYIVKSGLANDDFSKGREVILKDQLTEIITSPENLDEAQKTLNFKKLHYVMYESKHPEPARLLVEVLTADNANNEDINANLAKLLSVLDTKKVSRYHRETIFKALLDPQITSRLFTQNVVLPQFIQLVQKRSNYSSILQQRLLGEQKPKVLDWQLARALTTRHFTQLLDKRSSYSFFGKRQHPADKIAINYPQVIIEHLLTANDADRGELLRVLSAKRGIFNARNYLREFSDQQLGILLSYPECMQPNSVVQNSLTSLKLDDNRKIRVDAAKETAQKAKEFMVAHPDFLGFDAETWATHLHNNLPNAKDALKLCINENFPNNLNEQTRFNNAISELLFVKLQTEARQLHQNEVDTKEAQDARREYQEILAAQEAAEKKKRLAPLDLAEHRLTSKVNPAINIAINEKPAAFENNISSPLRSHKRSHSFSDTTRKRLEQIISSQEVTQPLEMVEENIFPDNVRNSSSSDSEKQIEDTTSSDGKDRSWKKTLSSQEVTQKLEIVDENIFPDEVRNSSSSDSKKQTEDRTNAADPLPIPLEILIKQPTVNKATSHQSQESMQDNSSSRSTDFSIFATTPPTTPNEQGELNPWKDFSTKLSKLESVFPENNHSTFNQLNTAFADLQAKYERGQNPISLGYDCNISSSDDGNQGENDSATSLDPQDTSEDNSLLTNTSATEPSIFAETPAAPSATQWDLENNSEHNSLFTDTPSVEFTEPSIFAETPAVPKARSSRLTIINSNVAVTAQTYKNCFDDDTSLLLEQFRNSFEETVDQLPTQLTVEQTERLSALKQSFEILLLTVGKQNHPVMADFDTSGDQTPKNMIGKN